MIFFIVLNFSTGVRTVSINTPFRHISVHVIKAPRVGEKLADIHGLLGIIAIISTAIPVIIGPRCINIIAP